MKITAQEEYGLRCLLAVARHATPDTPLSISEIARMEALSTQYVAKLMNILKRQKLVESTRGLCGGFRLARSAASISVSDALHALGGGFEIGNQQICNHFTGQKENCVHVKDCSMRPMWQTIIRHISEFFHNLSLQQLLDSEQQASMRMDDSIHQIAETHPAPRPVPRAGG
ncbi:MAG: Rrf2 family transcriptional regulator [Deltaproteobacteria bacterium]|nr:Rrf2 family transcriptional regulator [Deltaproteobacteria bacterium]